MSCTGPSCGLPAKKKTAAKSRTTKTTQRRRERYTSSSCSCSECGDSSSYCSCSDCSSPPARRGASPARKTKKKTTNKSSFKRGDCCDLYSGDCGPCKPAKKPAKKTTTAKKTTKKNSGY